MVTLYGYTILANLALMAIVVAIFVFASSMYRGALKISTREEEDSLDRRKELINSKRGELIKKIRGVSNSAFQKELRAELDKLDAGLNKIDQSILKSRNKAKALTARNIVLIPASFLLISIITSGIAIATSGRLPTIMWIVSLALLAAGLYFTYKNLSTIEFFSKVIDLGTLMEQALDRHRMKSTPIVEIEIPDFQLEMRRGETEEIICFASLKQGFIAKIRELGFQELRSWISQKKNLNNLNMITII